ncbi:MAG: PstS family phosphate ABC transporter substrate-binding protein [Aquimonas sp.]|nr:PstS family phosphate ABC transporter substrate-binding protein [Aquimonas sp.]
MARCSLLLPLLLLCLAGCTREPLPGLLRVDGSSTVYPLLEALAENYQRRHRGEVRIALGVSGTGGGFSRFCRGELDLANASRRIVDTERAACMAAGIEFLELQLALDAITLVVHPETDWVDALDLSQLRRIWAVESERRVLQWNQVDPRFPERPLLLFGPGADSGTFDYFTRAVNGRARSSRSDYTASESDNVLVLGVAQAPGALGFFGLSYYRQNANQLRALAVRGEGAPQPVMPSPESIRDGSYPFVRPMYLYVNLARLRAEPTFGKFLMEALEQAPTAAASVGFVPLPDAGYAQAQAQLRVALAGADR